MSANNILDEIHADVKTFVATNNKKTADLQAQIDYLANQAGAPRPVIGGGDPAAEIVLKFQDGRAAFDRSKRLCFEVASPFLAAKAVVTSTGLFAAAPSDVIGNAGGYGYGAVRSLFRAVPIDTGAVYQVREASAVGWNASPQSQGSAKNESVTTLTGETLSVATIAHWIAVTKQAADDVVGLQEFIRSRLLWGLAAEVEGQIVAGPGTADNLYGLSVQASTFNTALLTASCGWEYFDILGAASTQLKVAGWRPNFCLLHPVDAYKLRYVKDSLGQFIAAPPTIPPIVETVALSQGTFVVGDSSQAIVRVRQSATIDISESHSDFFIRNTLAIRAEERLCLVVTSPSAFITGNLNTSPL